MTNLEAKFQVGEIISHRLFDYLGVIYDVDPVFSGSDVWYEQVAHSRPPKNRPWYHVLVDGADHTTYVAEQNLSVAEEKQRINHKLVEIYFSEFNGKRYSLRNQMN